MMNVLEIKNVILILLLVLCFTNIVENTPNGKSLYTIKTRHRRHKSDVVGTTKWLRRFPKEDGIPFRRYLIRELSSNDDFSGKLGKSHTKRWLKRNLRKLEKKYFNIDFRRYWKSRVIRGKRRNKFKDKQWTEKHNREKDRKLRFSEFISPLHDRRLGYKNIATLRSQHLTESQMDGLDSNPLQDGLKFGIAFDVTLPHRLTSAADHAELMIYFSIGGNTNNDNTSTTRETHSCGCNIEIREFVWISGKKAMEETNNVVTLSKKSIKNNEWNSFDISDIIKTSALFSNNNRKTRNISTDVDSHIKIHDIDPSQGIIFRRNKDEEHNEDNTHKSPLLYLSFQYSNCSFPDKGLQPTTAKDHDNTENECALNLKPVINPRHYMDDKIPLLLLFSEIQNDVNDNTWKDTNDSEKTLSNSPTNDQNVLSSFRRRLVANHQQKTLESSGKNSFQNANANGTLSMSTIPKTRSKRRARKFRGGRNSCRRERMYVDFTNTEWADFIVFPKGYQAYQCVGRCYIPISQYLTPTMHAIIQNLMHASHPKKARRACCVPTKLKPMSMVYRDENEDTVKKDFKEMIVTECGCR